MGRGVQNILGLIFLYIVLQSIFGGAASGILPIFLLIGAISFFASLGQSRRMGREVERRARLSSNQTPARRMAPPPVTAAQAITPKSIAEQAVRRAGNKTDTWLLKLEDIGVLAYHGDDSPDVVRVNAVPTSTRHLRPFVVIDLPYQQGKGTIRFEMVDEQGQKRYEYSNVYHLKYGHNFLTPPTWLPLPTDRDTGRWRLKVSIGEKPLAIHDFTVRGEDVISSQIRNMLKEDGEIDPWLAKTISDHDQLGGSMSLDELLANQPDDLEAAEGKLR